MLDAIRFIDRYLAIDTVPGYTYQIVLLTDNGLTIDTYNLTGSGLPEIFDYDEYTTSEKFCLDKRRYEIDDFWWDEYHLAEATVTRCEIAPPCNESPYLTDTSTTAGTRTVSAGETLKMVYSGTNRTAEASFVCSGSNPVWSNGTGWTSSGMTANYSGTGNAGTSATRSGETYQFNVDIVSEDYFPLVVSSSAPGIVDLKGLLNDSIGFFTGDYSKVVFSGSFNANWRNVDAYNDGKSIGRRIELLSDLKCSMSKLTFDSPNIPIVVGVYVRGTAELDAFTVNLSGAYLYDPSVASNSSSSRVGLGVTSQLSGGFAGSFGEPHTVCAEVKLLVSASMSIAATLGGESGSDDITLVGSASLPSVNGKFTGSVKLGAWNCQIFDKTWPISSGFSTPFSKRWTDS